MKAAFVVYIFIMLLLYGAGSFMAWSFNPADWSVDGRVLISIIGLALFGYVINILIQEDINSKN